uniref:Thioredoxin domain-containing protein n=1 Tax=Heterorhabditis bacteriophora TaxID=37862 RepID=A0A1I7XTK6_HETBA
MASNLNGKFETQLMKAAQLVEEHIDSEIQRLDNLDEDDLETVRRKRMEELMKAQKAKNEMLTNGHGRYDEVADEKEFFEATKKSKNVVCLFYLQGNFRCKIVDKHFEKLCTKHIGTRFIHVNAEKVLENRLALSGIVTVEKKKIEKPNKKIIRSCDIEYDNEEDW